jgi:hypothetical protein
MSKRNNTKRWVVEADLSRPRIADALNWLEREQEDTMLTNVNQLVKLIEEIRTHRESSRSSGNPFR